VQHMVVVTRESGSGHGCRCDTSRRDVTAVLVPLGGVMIGWQGRR